MKIFGDLSGIKKSQIKRLQILENIKTNSSELISQEILNELIFLTSNWKKEIAVFINRSGKLVAFSVGLYNSVLVPSLQGRKVEKSRCIHTHPNGTVQLSSFDLKVLDELRIESIASIGIMKGSITGIQIAFKIKNRKPLITTINHGELNAFDYSKLLLETKEADKKTDTSLTIDEKSAILIVQNKEYGPEFLSELKDLAYSAGINVVGEMLLPLHNRKSHSYIGSGKMEELLDKIYNSKANLLICDDLTPGQLKTLNHSTYLKVIDRTGLVLDIFKQRAHSKEGKLQIELAQNQIMLSHLTGQGKSLSRLGGGIGTRGPGESKLESDRRQINERITTLEKELKSISKARETQRKRRAKSGLPLVALVGYTNAGKTTFMQKAIQQSGVYGNITKGENKLFATLDPTIRKIRIDDNFEILLSDTVGFIQKLPKNLLRAFLATLEEVRNADILIHVLDVSNLRCIEQSETVNEVLKMLECDNKPIITVLNKTDQIIAENQFINISTQVSHPVPISLLHDDSLKPVWEYILELLPVSV